MDKDFLRLMGDFLTRCAEGREEFDALARWMVHGYESVDAFAALFRTLYGLDPAAGARTASVKAWEQAAGDFRKSFLELVASFGAVPRSQHLELKEKYEALLEEKAALEETVRHLRQLLGQKHLGQEELNRGYQALLERQTAEFQKLTRGMTEFFGGKSASPEAPAKPKRAASRGGKKDASPAPRAKRPRKHARSNAGVRETRRFTPSS